MNVDKLNTIDQLTDFLDGTQPIAFCLASNKAERYQWVQQNIAKFHYRDLNKVDKGIVMRYLMKVSGYSPAQLKRLIKQYRGTGHLRPPATDGCRVYTSLHRRRYPPTGGHG